MDKQTKILITGCSGLLGSKLFLKLHGKYEVLGTYNSEQVDEKNCTKLDIVDREKVFSIIKKFKPQIIIHSAALTNVDYCEDHQKQTYAINVEGTKNVVEAAKTIAAKIVYISTDYIFDGKSGPYTEDDNPNPLNYYAKTKLEGEEIVKNSGLENLIIRSTVIYGLEKTKLNFAMWVINKLRRQGKISVVDDQYGSPTFADSAAEIIIKLLEGGRKGIYNVAGPGIMSRYEFALKIADVFDLDKTLITPIQTKGLRQKAPRPLKAGLKIDKVKTDLGIEPLNVKEALEKMKLWM